jgi:hypothetical protein
MSAYIVDDKTINKVVSYFAQKAYSNAAYFTGRPIREDANYNLFYQDDCRDLANDMFKLNCQAVKARYGKGQAEEFRPLNFRYRTESPGTKMAVYKALQCWKYQCSEGNIPDSKLYKVMSKVLDRLAHEIVQDLPVYQKTNWG